MDIIHSGYIELQREKQRYTAAFSLDFDCIPMQMDFPTDTASALAD